MRLESERGLPNETGGVLVGHVDPTGRTVITALIGPGPRAFRTPSRFRRDGEYAQREVDRLHRESDGLDDYIGEWHSHPAAVGPSGVDRGSMEWIGKNERYRREQPFLIIMQRSGARAWRPLIYRWIGGRLTDVGSVSRRDQRGDVRRRLRASLASEAETRFFERQYKRWLRPLGPRTPALVPQAYLHYDPFTVRQRVEGMVLPRQRMDFLLLFSPQERVVVEIDGKDHYADGEIASPARYAERVAADRELCLSGYEIYRFGGHDLLGRDVHRIIDAFFERLFTRHGFTCRRAAEANGSQPSRLGDPLCYLRAAVCAAQTSPGTSSSTVTVIRKAIAAKPASERALPVEDQRSDVRA